MCQPAAFLSHDDGYHMTLSKVRQQTIKSQMGVGAFLWLPAWAWRWEDLYNQTGQ